MRYPASEKAEIIQLVEQSHLPVKRRVSGTMCKKVSVSLPLRGDSHDDQYDDHP